jgi:hypothetical protein
MKASHFDRAFDNGQTIAGMLDVGNAKRPVLQSRRANVDLPSWVVRLIDREARRIGRTRQSLIKLWLAQRLRHPY